MPSEPDVDLLRRFVRGDRDAFESLFRLFSPDDDGLKRLLRSVYPRVTAELPSRDVWPGVVERLDAPAAWSWFDLTLLAALAGAPVVSRTGVATGVSLLSLRNSRIPSSQI